MANYQSAYTGEQIDKAINGVLNILGSYISTVSISATSYTVIWKKDPTTTTTCYGITVDSIGRLCRVYKNGTSYSLRQYDQDNNTDATRSGIGLCTTGAATAAKFVNFPYFYLTTSQNIIIYLAEANTSASALTLNVNSSGVRPIYIDSVATSTTNYKLPAGFYLATYNGTYWNLSALNRKLLNNSDGSICTKAYMEYNTTDDCIDFIFD